MFEFDEINAIRRLDRLELILSNFKSMRNQRFELVRVFKSEYRADQEWNLVTPQVLRVKQEKTPVFGIKDV